MAEGQEPEGRLTAAVPSGSAALAPSGTTRTCVGCRRLAAPDELVRVVLGPEGTLRVGRTLPGRGAWLCAESPRCVQQAARRNAFSRALRAPVSPDVVLALWPGSAG